MVQTKILIFVCIAEQQEVMPRKFEDINKHNLDYQFFKSTAQRFRIWIKPVRICLVYGMTSCACGVHTTLTSCMHHP